MASACNLLHIRGAIERRVSGRAAIVYSKGAAANVQGGCEDWLPTCRGALDAVPIE